MLFSKHTEIIKEYIEDFMPKYTTWSNMILSSNTIEFNNKGICIYLPPININYTFFCYYSIKISNGQNNIRIISYINEGSSPNNYFRIYQNDNIIATRNNCKQELKLKVYKQNLTLQLNQEEDTNILIPFNLTDGDVLVEEIIGYWYTQNSIPKGLFIGLYKDLPDDSYNKYKCLVKQNNNYIAIKPEFYKELGQPKDDFELDKWFEEYGAEDLTAITIEYNKNIEIGIDKGIIGQGKYFSIDFPSDFLGISEVK